MSRRLSRIILGGALLALTLLFVAWFHDDRHRVAALAVFALPPLLLLAGVLRGSGKATIWAGVFGLFWFSHGVMVAWSRVPERAFAGLEIVLALAIILASSWPGLRAVFSRRR
jgi:uncharacterized membrane protein